jgi:hypothetical protein
MRIYAYMKTRLNLKIYFSFLAILFIANSQAVLGQNFIIEENLSLDWVFYDEDKNALLPLLENNSEYPETIHLDVDLDYAKEAYLMIDITENTSLFIENKFVQHYDERVVRYFLLDSLQEIFQADALQLTLFNKEGFEHPGDSKIGFIRRSFNSAMNVNPISERNMDNGSNYYKIIILILITFFVILYVYFPAELFDFLSLRLLMTFRYTDTFLTKYRSLTKTQTLVIMYQAALLSAILVVFLNYYNNPLEQLFIFSINPILSWLLIFVIVLISIFLKIILIGAISSLFGISDRKNFYFIEFLRMAMIFYSIVFIIVSYVVINQFYLIDFLLDKLVLIVIIFNLTRFLILYFKFRSAITIKSLHLFSYLCTTELIPIIIGLKFFIK